MLQQQLHVIECKSILILNRKFYSLFTINFNFIIDRWENRGKSPWNGMLSLIVVGHLVLNTIFSMFLLCIASCNYPGGLAIARLHRLEQNSTESVYVHIDNLAAQTGVSRFTQTNSSWM